MIDSPHGLQGTTGGAVSAPVFKRIADATLRYYGVPQTINPPPPVLVPRHVDADVREVSFAPAGPVMAMPADTSDVMPSVLGQSARDAVRTLARVGLVARVSGEGVVAHQEPAPGAAVEPGGICRLQLSRAALVGASQP